MTIALVDTSVFCNIVPVPGLDEHRSDIIGQLGEFIQDNVTLFLPVATILETGRHIAHLSDGQLRRSAAQRFVGFVTQALDSGLPWTVPQPLLDPQALREYLTEFPDFAMRGLTLADLSIVKEFECQCRLHTARRVFIWSLDHHLSVCDRHP
jgi:hypothetical protein